MQNKREKSDKRLSWSMRCSNDLFILEITTNDNFVISFYLTR